ncbi:hydroxypyruvate isomerase [Massilia sp. DD77]|uniref:hydroxypyruvate isomerase n=1 Tax=Massilia sp. DD77 TaxID=3109349 RepID=UPI002FFEAE74
MPQFAANLSMLFNEAPFLERFALARASGFEGVECMFPYGVEADSIAQRLERQQLKMVLHNLPAGDWAAGERGLACDPRRVGEFQDSVALALDYALELGTPRLHCLAGLLPQGVARERAHAAYVENLRFAAARCAEHGIDLLIEPINDRDVPGYFLTGTRQAAEVIAECGAANLFMQYDIYHMQRMEGDLAATLRHYLGLIRHIQLADVPGRHQPGSGEIHFPFLFRLLDELGYEGWVGCEYLPLGATHASFGWLEEYRRDR